MYANGVVFTNTICVNTMQNFTPVRITVAITRQKPKPKPKYSVCY